MATANFIAQDRPDVRFAVKELCREMARPTCASWRKLKKLARYLRGQPGVVLKIKLDVDGVGNEVKIIVDSDWAGCLQTRRSTNGGCIMVSDAKSRGFEQRRGRVLRGGQGNKPWPWFLGRLRWLGNLDQWCGITQGVTDSSARKGICQRTSLGKNRHIDVAMLWRQDLVRKGRNQMSKIPGKENPADLLTKYLPGVTVAAISRAVDFFVEGGRSDIVDAAYVGAV